MVSLRLSTIALGVACVLTFAQGAQARGPYDGSWSVTVSGRAGACQGGTYQYNLQIINGGVRYYGGDARIAGRVSRNGAVSVQVSSSSGNAVGAGHLRGSTGGGSWRGYSQSGACAGTWYAQRSGY